MSKDDLKNLINTLDLSKSDKLEIALSLIFQICIEDDGIDLFMIYKRLGSYYADNKDQL